MSKIFRARLDLMPGDPAASIPAAPAPANRWTLSTGAPVLTCIDGINGDQVVTLIIDLATLRLRASVIALLDHRDGVTCEDDAGFCRSACILGSWDDTTLETDPAGLVGLSAVFRPRVLPPVSDMGYDQEWEARAALDLIAQRMPVQASVGAWSDPQNAASGFFLLTAPETINGRTIAPDPARPVYVGRNLDLAEGSVCLFGADGRTGCTLSAPVFPRATPPTAPEVPMPARLRALLNAHPAAHHALIAGLVADGKPDADIAEEIRKADADAVKAQLTALAAENAILKAQLAKGTPTPVKLPDGASGGAGNADDAEQPATFKAALSRPEVAHVKGLERVQLTASLWPGLVTARA